MKKFLLKDHSGRGISTTLTLEQFGDNGWDLSYSNNPEDEHETTLNDWLEDAELGDEYRHDDENCTITCIADENTMTIPDDIVARAKASKDEIVVTPSELVALMQTADEALNGDSNDAEHDALYELREELSEIFEDPNRRRRNK